MKLKLKREILDVKFARLDPASKLHECLGPDFEPNEGAIHVLVLAPAAAKKRTLVDIGDSIVPSWFAQGEGLNGWVRWLSKLDSQIECHRIERSEHQRSLPLVLLNETFIRTANQLTSPVKTESLWFNCASACLLLRTMRRY